MTNIIKFKATEKIVQKRLKEGQQTRLNYLYHITHGFEFPAQDPDVRLGFEKGEFEL